MSPADDGRPREPPIDSIDGFFVSDMMMVNKPNGIKDKSDGSFWGGMMKND